VRDACLGRWTKFTDFLVVGYHAATQQDSMEVDEQVGRCCINRRPRRTPLAFGVLSGHACAKAPAYPVIRKSAFFERFFGDMVACVDVSRGYLAATQLYASGSFFLWLRAATQRLP